MLSTRPLRWWAGNCLLPHTASFTRSKIRQARQPRVHPCLAAAGDICTRTSHRRGGGCPTTRNNQLRRGEASAAVSHRAPAAAAGYGELAESAAGSGANYASRRFHGAAALSAYRLVALERGGSAMNENQRQHLPAHAIRIRTDRGEGDCVRPTVQDTGVGIT